jgi:hypothetical protein
MQTIEQFIEKHEIRIKKMTVGSAWRECTIGGPVRTDKWAVAVLCGDSSMVTEFHKGEGHKRASPKVGEVLSCLAFDAASVEETDDFDEWANDYAIDMWDGEALRMYRACEKIRDDLRKLLGSEAYEELLYKTERL